MKTTKLEGISEKFSRACCHRQTDRLTKWARQAQQKAPGYPGPSAVGNAEAFKHRKKA